MQTVGGNGNKENNTIEIMRSNNPIILYEELREKLYGFINARVKNNELAKDILHDTFLRMVEHCDKDCHCDHPKAYVFRTTTNLIADHFRKEKKQLSAPEPIEDDNFLNDEMIACLILAVEQLPEKYRVAVRMADVERLPQQQIADHLGISLSAIKMRVQRGREKLKQLILATCLVEVDKYGNILICEQK